MTDYASVLTRNYPSRLWTLNGSTYAGLTFLDGGPVISKAQLDGEWPAVQSAITLEQAQKNRAEAYAAESDPLFFNWQRGEGTESDWLDAVTAIRNRYPYP